MKRIILTQVLLLAITCSIGQTYTPFLQNIGWCVEEYYGTGSVMNAYENDGDTIIGSLSYSKLIQNEISFLLREDTTLKKVWVILPDSTTETLLYDFSVSLGSQINLSYVGGATITYNIESFDSINTPLGARKRITLNTTDTIYDPLLYWIEGVGSSYSPIFLTDPTFSFGDIGHCLICSYQSIGIQSYSGSCGIPCISLPGGPCYSFIVGIEENKSENSGIFITPGNNQVTIKSRSTKRIESIRLVSIEGKIMRSQQRINERSITIRTNSCPKGIYLIEAIMEDGEVITKKLAM